MSQFKARFEPVHRELARRGTIAGLPLSAYFPERSRELLLCFTEMNRKPQIDRFAKDLAEAL